jgi:hypothetical protein
VDRGQTSQVAFGQPNVCEEQFEPRRSPRQFRFWPVWSRLGAKTQSRHEEAGRAPVLDLAVQIAGTIKSCEHGVAQSGRSLHDVWEADGVLSSQASSSGDQTLRPGFFAAAFLVVLRAAAVFEVERW